MNELFREDFFKRIYQIKQYIDKHQYSQKQAGEKLGLSPAAVSNKLRLLQYSKLEQSLILSAHLSERHARAVLQIKNPQNRLATLLYIIEKQFNVAQTEEHINFSFNVPPFDYSGQCFT